jgi:nicotinamidase-related amidase
MLLDVQESQLVLVDYQDKLMPAIHEAEAVLRNGECLARVAAALGVPVFGTEENPQSLGGMVEPVRSLVPKIVPKMEFSALGVLAPLLRPVRAASPNARSIPKHLQKPQQPDTSRNSIVLAGCEAHVCLMQTALDLLDEEFDVWVVTDACSSRTERNRDAAFDRLASAGAELVTTEMVAFEWLRSAEHPRFKDVLTLVK